MSRRDEGADVRLVDLRPGQTFKWARPDGSTFGWLMRRTPKGLRDHRGTFHRLPAGVTAWRARVAIVAAVSPT